MKKAVPHPVSSGTAGGIGPCPSILPGKTPHVLILSDEDLILICDRPQLLSFQ